MKFAATWKIPSALTRTGSLIMFDRGGFSCFQKNARLLSDIWKLQKNTMRRVRIAFQRERNFLPCLWVCRRIDTHAPTSSARALTGPGSRGGLGGCLASCFPLTQRWILNTPSHSSPAVKASASVFLFGFRVRTSISLPPDKKNNRVTAGYRVPEVLRVPRLLVQSPQQPWGRWWLLSLPYRGGN